MAMLTRLEVNDLAILENVDVPFEDGFTVLTGATGAGKSLIIDSLSLLLGARAFGELIRQGKEKALIRGYFHLTSAKALGLLTKLEIPLEEGNVIVERVISTGKSLIKVNSVAVSLGTLNRIAPYLANIHSQFDFAKILNPENYIELIDGYAGEKSITALEHYRN